MFIPRPENNLRYIGNWNSGYPKFQSRMPKIGVSDVQNCHFGYQKFISNSGYAELEFCISRTLIFYIRLSAVILDIGNSKS
jgi:hypothetical protein